MNYANLTFFPNDRVYVWCDVCGQEGTCIAYEYQDGAGAWRGGYACEQCTEDLQARGDDAPGIEAPRAL